MNRKSYALTALFATGVLMIGHSGVAQSQRGLDAHEHGVAVLNLAQEEQVVHIEFTSPAMNIVGFEHPPQNEADTVAVEKAIALLETNTDLLRFTDEASCSLTDSHVEYTHGVEFAEHHDETDAHRGDAKHDEDHDKEDHKKDDHHKTEHHKEAHHKESEGAHDDEHDAHAEFSVVYEYNCQSPDNLDDMSTRLFELFPGLESLQVNAVLSTGQSAVTLSAQSNSVSF